MYSLYNLVDKLALFVMWFGQSAMILFLAIFRISIIRLFLAGQISSYINNYSLWYLVFNPRLFVTPCVLYGFISSSYKTLRHDHRKDWREMITLMLQYKDLHSLLKMAKYLFYILSVLSRFQGLQKGIICSVLIIKIWSHYDLRAMTNTICT